jgi:DNA-binding transcriptional MerR regulator
MKIMKIGQLAQIAAVNPRTIRFYESKGLLSPASRSSNKYRQYTDKELSHLLFIRRAQSLGLSLGEIQMLLQYKIAGRCSGLKSHLEDLLKVKIAEMKKRAAELLAFGRDLERIRQRLQRLAKSEAATTPSFCDCLSITLPSDLDGCARNRPDLIGAKFTGRKEVRGMAEKKSKAHAKAPGRNKRTVGTRPPPNCGCGCVPAERK